MVYIVKLTNTLLNTYCVYLNVHIHDIDYVYYFITNKAEFEILVHVYLFSLFSLLIQLVNQYTRINIQYIIYLYFV